MIYWNNSMIDNNIGVLEYWNEVSTLQKRLKNRQRVW